MGTTCSKSSFSNGVVMVSSHDHHHHHHHNNSSSGSSDYPDRFASPNTTTTATAATSTTTGSTTVTRGMWDRPHYLNPSSPFSEPSADPFHHPKSLPPPLLRFWGRRRRRKGDPPLDAKQPPPHADSEMMQLYHRSVQLTCEYQTMMLLQQQQQQPQQWEAPPESSPRYNHKNLPPPSQPWWSMTSSSNMTHPHTTAGQSHLLYKQQQQQLHHHHHSSIAATPLAPFRNTTTTATTTKTTMRLEDIVTAALVGNHRTVAAAVDTTSHGRRCNSTSRDPPRVTSTTTTTPPVPTTGKSTTLPSVVSSSLSPTSTVFVRPASFQFPMAMMMQEQRPLPTRRKTTNVTSSSTVSSHNNVDRRTTSTSSLLPKKKKKKDRLTQAKSKSQCTIYQMQFQTRLLVRRPNLYATKTKGPSPMTAASGSPRSFVGLKPSSPPPAAGPLEEGISQTHIYAIRWPVKTKITMDEKIDTTTTAIEVEDVTQYDENDDSGACYSSGSDDDDDDDDSDDDDDDDDDTSQSTNDTFAKLQNDPLMMHLLQQNTIVMKEMEQQQNRQRNSPTGPLSKNVPFTTTTTALPSTKSTTTSQSVMGTSLIFPSGPNHKKNADRPMIPNHGSLRDTTATVTVHPSAPTHDSTTRPRKLAPVMSGNKNNNTNSGRRIHPTTTTSTSSRHVVALVDDATTVGPTKMAHPVTLPNRTTTTATTTTTTTSVATSPTPSTDHLFQPPAMALPPKRKVVDWVTVSSEHKIFVADVGLSMEECNHMVAITEQQCRGQYAAYTYAKQTLGCREFPVLAHAVQDAVHTVVSAILEECDKTTTTTATTNLDETTTTPPNLSAKPTRILALDDREPHMVKYDVTKKERQKLDMHTDKSEWTFLIAISNGAGMDYVGGGTYFECLDATVHVQRGHALIFPGKLRHCGQRITSGLRFLLVGFLVDKTPKKATTSDDVARKTDHGTVEDENVMELHHLLVG